MAYSPDGKTLAATGMLGIAGMSGPEMLSWAAFLLIGGGTLVAIGRTAPKPAYQSLYDMKQGRYRMMLTLNGHPIKFRNPFKRRRP